MFALTRGLRLPGMGSIRGRYMYGAVLFLAALFAAVWLAQDRVQQATSRVMTHAGQRQEAGQMLKSLTLQAWATQTALQGYLWTPDARRMDLVNRGLDQTLVQVNALKNHAYGAGMSHDIGAIEVELNKLHETMHSIVPMRAAPEKLHPALSLVREKTMPAFGTIWMALDNMEKSLEVVMTENQSDLAGVAQGMFVAFQVFAAMTAALVLAGLLFFEVAIRRPLAMVAKALKAQASGASNIPVLSTRLAETRDLSEAFEHMRTQVQTRQQRLETILDNAAEGIITFDKNGVIEGFNRAAEKLFGYAQNEIKGSDIALLIPPTDPRNRRKDYLDHFMRTEIARMVGREGEVVGLHKDGTRFSMALKISEMTLEGRPFYTGLVADISERKALHDRLKTMAERDGLTGLYNRTYFLEDLGRTVARARRDRKTYAILYIDLDNFKYVNDTLGHMAGDTLLVEVASLLNKRARESDLLARLGGDEFTVLLYDITAENVLNVAESFRGILSQFRFTHHGKRVDIGASIGVSLITAKTESAAQAMSQADIGCHLAKRRGRNCVHLYNPDDATNMASMALDMGWSQRIRDAIEHDRFVLAYQPIVETVTGRIESYEVLLRLRDENGELILPGGFLPAAERFGLSVEIDRWVIVHALDMLAKLRETRPGLRFSINLSGQTLSDLRVCDLIVNHLSKTGLDPSALTFEITETAAIADMTQAGAFLSRLQQIGCLTALDDFGSGLSSFTYLRDLPVDIVKIDGSFVRNMASNDVDQATVKAMNDIAHAMGKTTIAEFVESEDILKLLAEYGIDRVQGYYFGRPEPMPSRGGREAA